MEVSIEYVDEARISADFLEGMAVILWSLEAFLREEAQLDVANSVLFLGNACSDRSKALKGCESEK